MLPRASSSRTLLIFAAAGLVAWLAQSQTVVGQYSKVATPLINVNDGFFENFGLGFGFGIAGSGGVPGQGSGIFGLAPNGSLTPNIRFSQGGANAALPPFGGRGQGAGGRFGFGIGRGNGGFASLNLAAAQGSDRSLVMQSPTVVVPNGGTGTFVDVRQTPFVTGLIPVVGLQLPPMITPLQDKLSRLSPGEIQALGQSSVSGGNDGYEDRRRSEPAGPPSSASHGDISVADIHAQQSTEVARSDDELQALIARARGAEAAGKLNVARIYYNMAIRRAAGQTKAELKSKVQALKSGGEATR
jgi:hypothetical protein